MARRGDGLYLRGKTWYLDSTHRHKRHISRLGAHISRSAARELASITRARVLKGEVGIGAPPPITVADYATRWLRQITSHVTPKTAEGYRQMLHYYILPTLGKRNLGTVDRGAVKALLAERRAAGYSKSTVRFVRATLSVLCADAIEDGFLVVNPAQGLSRRGRSGPGTISQAERQASIRPLSVSQLDAFLSTVSDAGAPQEAVLFLTLADAGLRPGEALALQWTDLDVATQEILVERALAGTTIKPTKTYARRRVELTPRLLAALEDLANDSRGRGARRQPRAGAVALHRSLRPAAHHQARGLAIPVPLSPRRAAPLPALRSAAFLRDPSPRRERADHLRGHPDGALEAHHHARLLRALVADTRAGVGGSAPDPSAGPLGPRSRGEFVPTRITTGGRSGTRSA
jgi:integrase